MKNKKAYIKKKGEIGNKIVWEVDGTYIRSKIDPDFTNFGQHFRFKFIPLNEFWIDEQYGKDETKFFLKHLLVEHDLMSRGKKYIYASKKACIAEKAERDKARKLKKSELVRQIKKKHLTEFGKNLKIWLIRGDIVRELFYIDFTQGGHDLVYDFVPKNEIWIDDALNPKEIKLVLLHELHERNNMLISKKNRKSYTKKDRKKSYDAAHKKALIAEEQCRNHPSEINKLLKDEIEKFKNIK